MLGVVEFVSEVKFHISCYIGFTNDAKRWETNRAQDLFCFHTPWISKIKDRMSLLKSICRRGPPRGKRDGVIWHILERENVNWVKIMAWLREKSIWHPAWLGKLGVNMNFRQFLSVICAKNLRESGISSPSWGAPLNLDHHHGHVCWNSSWQKYLVLDVYRPLI